MHSKRFYLLPELISDYSYITGSDAIHISRVLRMKTGQQLEIFDGMGRNYIAKIVDIHNNIVKTKIVKSLKNNRDSPLIITLAQAFLKEKKMESLIRQLTELGVKSCIFFSSNRSVPIINIKRLSSRINRWLRISIEATKQCRRGFLPIISYLKKFEDVLNLLNEYDLGIIFWEESSSNLNISSINKYRKKINKILIIIGPEGGFDKQDIENAKNKGFIISSLGPRILRSETASIAACSIIQYLFGDLNKNP